MLVDLETPGVTVRPIENIAGHEEFCEVFFDDVQVPKDNLVGDISEGWTIAKALLGFERLFLGSPKLPQNALARLDSYAQSHGLHDDPEFSAEFTKLQLDVADLSEAFESYAAQVRAGERLGAEVSWLKIWGTETYGRIAELAMQVADGEAPIVEGQSLGNGASSDMLSLYFSCLPTTIYGGSNEIQRNILAKQVLRLPT